MEEIHSIFAVGAGAISKLVRYVPANMGESKIVRLFNPKFPYEYLKNENKEHPYRHFSEEIINFYKGEFGLEI
jgi:hypothetical protein